MCAVVCAVVVTMIGVKYVTPRGALVRSRECARHRQLVRMNLKSNLLDELRREWRQTGRRPSAQRACRRLSDRYPQLDLAHETDLCGVVELLESRSPRSALERAAIVRVLLREASDPDVHRALLQTLLPGLVSVCRQLRFGRGVVDEPSEIIAVAVALLSELLVDWAGQSREYPAGDILSALRGRLRRWLLREKTASAVLSPVVAIEPPALEPSPLLTRLESLCTGEHERLARLAYARIFEGASLRDLGHRDHSAPVSLQTELQRFALHHLL